MSQRVLIVGAGAIGVCCAAYLVRAGHQVTLVDRLAPGDGCSFGNAGALFPASCVPEAMPGVLRKIPGWLWDKEGPLTIRWAYLPRLAPWLLRFARSARMAQIRHTADAQIVLNAPTLETYQELTRWARGTELIRESDALYVYGSQRSFRSDRLAWRLRRERGVAFEVLDAAGIRELEPDLSPHYVCGVRISGQGYTVNPSRLVKALAARIVEEGGNVLCDEVHRLETGRGRVSAVHTGARRLVADRFVIAAGAWSTRLTKQLGIRVPLEAERGYHATVESPGVRISRPITEGDAGFLATPMEMGLRFAGTVELASVNAPPDYARVQAIVRRARHMLPALDSKRYTQWMGCRPSLPDDLPVIGRAPTHDNVWLAFGHGHRGLMGAPMTGRLVSGMVSGDPPNVDVQPYRVDRF